MEFGEKCDQNVLALRYSNTSINGINKLFSKPLHDVLYDPNIRCLCTHVGVISILFLSKPEPVKEMDIIYNHCFPQEEIAARFLLYDSLFFSQM